MKPVKTFYAALSPEQQKTFDAEIPPPRPGKHRGGRDHGGMRATTTAPMATAAAARHPHADLAHPHPGGHFCPSSPQSARIAGFHGAGSSLWIKLCFPAEQLPSYPHKIRRAKVVVCQPAISYRPAHSGFAAQIARSH